MEIDGTLLEKGREKKTYCYKSICNLTRIGTLLLLVSGKTQFVLVHECVDELDDGGTCTFLHLHLDANGGHQVNAYVQLCGASQNGFAFSARVHIWENTNLYCICSVLLLRKMVGFLSLSLPGRADEVFGGGTGGLHKS